MHTTIEWTVLAFAGLMLAALVLEPAARRLRLPPAAMLVLAGFIGSEVLVGAGLDLGLRWYHFRDLVLFVLIPVLVFASALRIDAKVLLRHLYLVLVLAVPVFLISALFVAVLLYWGIGYPKYFPWTTALIAGALVAATDPVAVLDLLRARGVSERLNILLEGESLFNDAGAIVLYNVLLVLALHPETMGGWDNVAWEFVWVFFGGAAVGAGFGLLAWGLYRLFTEAHHHVLMSLALAYLGYLAADSYLQVSGIMSVLVIGLFLGAQLQRKADGDSFVLDFWDFGAFVANAVAFLLVGVTITLNMFTDMWLAMLIGIAAVLLARGVGAFVILPAATLVPGATRLSAAERTIVGAGGLRGVMTAALALSLPTQLEGWWVVQSVGYGVVVFTLFVQGPTLALGLRRLVR